MFAAVLAGPRVTVHLLRRLFAATLEAAESVPRIATALDDIRATVRHLERLLTYVAEELPELSDHLDRIRARLDGLEALERQRHQARSEEPADR
ncbi:hypothetical protein GCM10022222_56070 [Amycolatopsis ultiminotia]|uniref:Uncharacterized protein n=1 Tax=Amycolatopsis ultiminotia TaxID=543629 RepID=A0ABP6XDA9_9PSEU